MRIKLTVAIALVVVTTAMHLTAQERDLERRIDETVRELGVLESANVVEIRSPVNSTILSVVPEGTVVKAGDLLVGLDPSRLEDEHNNQRVKLSTSQADLIEAKSRLEAVKIESRSGTEIAGLAVKVADLELQRFVGDGGEMALRTTEADAELSVARARLKAALHLAELVAAKQNTGISVPDETSTAALGVVEAKEKLTVAEAKKRWLEEHVRGHQSAALKLALLGAQLELTRGKHEFGRQLAKAEADLRTAEAVQAAEQAKFERLETQLAGCQVRAPKGGIVVDPITTTNRGVRSPLIEVGSEVRQRQPILRVVDMQNLHVRVKVHQSRTSRVRVGQPAVVRFDALLNRSFSGRVIQVNATPEPTSWLDGNIKRYAVLVSIDNAPQALRLGMTAVAEIDISGENVSKPGIGPRSGL